MPGGMALEARPAQVNGPAAKTSLSNPIGTALCGEDAVIARISRPAVRPVPAIRIKPASTAACIPRMTGETRSSSRAASCASSPRPAGRRCSGAGKDGGIALG